MTMTIPVTDSEHSTNIIDKLRAQNICFNPYPELGQQINPTIKSEKDVPNCGQKPESATETVKEIKDLNLKEFHCVTKMIIFTSTFLSH